MCMLCWVRVCLSSCNLFVIPSMLSCRMFRVLMVLIDGVWVRECEVEGLVEGLLCVGGVGVGLGVGDVGMGLGVGGFGVGLGVFGVVGLDCGGVGGMGVGEGVGARNCMVGRVEGLGGMGVVGREGGGVWWDGSGGTLCDVEGRGGGGVVGEVVFGGVRL